MGVKVTSKVVVLPAVMVVSGGAPVIAKWVVLERVGNEIVRFADPLFSMVNVCVSESPIETVLYRVSSVVLGVVS